MMIYHPNYKWRIDLANEDESREEFELCQQTIREAFNDEIAPAVIEQYGSDDTVALDEAFNNWTDWLCKDGEISEYLYENITRED